MTEQQIYLKDITGKDEVKAQKAADYLINSADTQLFQLLVDKSEFLFDFVMNNVLKRIEKAVSQDNFMNILNFFEIYSPNYDDLFASILAKHANQDLTDDIFEMLEKGSLPQKTYAAKYFLYIPDTVSIELLGKYAFSDDDNLSYNSAEALGQMQDDISFDIALSSLESDDDFERLKAVKFFTAYGKNFPFKEIFTAMSSSKMPENIAGQIPYMESLLSLLNSDMKKETLSTIDYIISGIGEILPLSDIFQFELYEVFNNLININHEDNEYSGKIAEILLSAYSKFKTFTENQEYIFDENKDTKNEISSIHQLLKSLDKEFWDKQKKFILKELSSSSANAIIPAVHTIAEYCIKDAIPQLRDLINTEDEIIVCEVLSTLKSLEALNDFNIDSISERIKNPNIKAIIQNLRD